VAILVSDSDAAAFEVLIELIAVKAPKFVIATMILSFFDF
jgi:hypothetical protein